MLATSDASPDKLVINTSNIAGLLAVPTRLKINSNLFSNVFNDSFYP